MNLMKWFRKNKTKVMAMVVILLMVVFILQFALENIRSQPQSVFGVGGRKVATIAGKINVTDNDLTIADNELKVLERLGADVLLSRMMQIPIVETPDLQAFFLGQLLFSRQKTTPDLMNQVKRTIYSKLYDISEKQINDMYRRSLPGSAIYWHCLKTEAKMAGIRVSNEEAGEQLARAIPLLFQGRNYSQVVGSMVNQDVSEGRILEAFGNLLAVLRYSNIVCSGEDITIRQLKQSVAWDAEGLNIEFVELNPGMFIKSQQEPSEEAITAHFNKYKKYFSGETSDENPYGFGYKLPDRLRLEYIVVKLDEISKIVKATTQQEIDKYYDSYKIQLFTEQVPSDPNDPNSPLITRTKSQSSVTNLISKQLKQEKLNSKAEEIIREAISITEEPFQDFNEAEIAALDADELAKLVGDYKTTAEQLSKKHGVEVYTGRTGMLNAFEMQIDKRLSRLYLLGYGQNPVPLTKVVFAVPELAASELGPFDAQAPRMHENIGPVRDVMSIQGGTGEMIAVVKVVEVAKAGEPENIDVTFSTESILPDPNEQDEEDNVFSVKEQVVEDLKKFAALNTAKSKADEFIKLAESQDWQSAVDRFNELYSPKEKDPNDPNSTVADQEQPQKEFRLENLPGMRVISKEKLDSLEAQGAGNPAAQYISNERRKSTMLMEQLYNLIPADSNSVENLPLIFEYKADMSVFCIKNLKIRRIWKEDYTKAKSRQLYVHDNVQYQSMAAVHFNPENILKRLKFELVNVDDVAVTQEPETTEVSDEEFFE
ncbi:MAG: hypothetical protein JW715_04270 [Sedimentisphaerales bacterium]|nr:hypothetical protein [Sedimentisphaerales bacterium]